MPSRYISLYTLQGTSWELLLFLAILLLPVTLYLIKISGSSTESFLRLRPVPDILQTLLHSSSFNIGKYQKPYPALKLTEYIPFFELSMF